jgi:hypothetical protein
MYTELAERAGQAKQEKRLLSSRHMRKNSLPKLKIIGFEIPRTLAPTSEYISKAKGAFEEKITSRPEIKKDKSAKLNKGIMKLYFNGGKKKKIRAVDFVGTIAKIPGMTAGDIGIITIQDNVSYVEILNGKGPIVLKAMKNTTIKGKLLKVHEANK